jgi:hypothetical protein
MAVGGGYPKKKSGSDGIPQKHYGRFAYFSLPKTRALLIFDGLGVNLHNILPAGLEGRMAANTIKQNSSVNLFSPLFLYM